MAELAAIISRTDLGEYLRRDLTDDDMALIAINAASTAVRSLTEQEITASEMVATFTPEAPTRKLLLPQLPVIEVAEVTVDDEVTIDWSLSPSGILRNTEGSWAADSTIEVEFSYGYEDIPSDLRMVALTMAARVYHQGLVRQETVGGSSTTYSTAASTDLSSGERIIIAKYRVRRGQGEVVAVGAEA